VAITLCADTENGDEAMHSVEMLAMEDILQSIKQEMERDHAVYVNAQLLGAMETSNELRKCLPNFSDDVDPFASMHPLDSNTHATMETSDRVGSTD
jgi:hypothetical protein